MSDSHSLFIALAYGIAAIALFGAIAALLMDYGSLKQSLRRLGAPVDERSEEDAR